MRLWQHISQAFLAQQPLSAPPATPTNALTAPTMANANATIYFGYGSNLWRQQMQSRCPTSEYLGVARLNDYKWLINQRGYANVVEINSSSSSTPSEIEKAAGKQKPSPYANEVWGLVYTLEPNDEARLDRNEGVPVAYTKENITCDFWAVHDGRGPANVTEKPREVEMLVYINREQVEPSEPKEEYVYRMNMGIKDAVKEGVPEGYVRDVMRGFIPEAEGGVEGGSGSVVERVAMRQAVEFEEGR